MDGSLLAVGLAGFGAGDLAVRGVFRGLPVTDVDAQFFAAHPGRRARIRLPGGPSPYTDKQRAVRYLSESEMEFRSLGPHDKSRRRIIAYRLPADHPQAPNHVLKIPFLAFADETIEDNDATLLPIVDQIMKDAAK